MFVAASGLCAQVPASPCTKDDSVDTNACQSGDSGQDVGLGRADGRPGDLSAQALRGVQALHSGRATTTRARQQSQAMPAATPERGPVPSWRLIASAPRSTASLCCSTHDRCIAASLPRSKPGGSRLPGPVSGFPTPSLHSGAVFSFPAPGCADGVRDSRRIPERRPWLQMKQGRSLLGLPRLGCQPLRLALSGH